MAELLSIENLSIGYQTDGGEVSAVSDVSLSIAPKQIYALVGESGCGKSTLASSIMRLVAAPGRITGAGRSLRVFPKRRSPPCAAKRSA